MEEQSQKKPNPYTSKAEAEFIKDRDKYRLKKQKKEEQYNAKNQKLFEKILKEYESGYGSFNVGEEYPISERGKKPKVQKKENESKLKLIKSNEVCPKCGKVHSAKVGCAVANFKNRK